MTEAPLTRRPNEYWPVAAALVVADQLTKYLVSDLNRPLEIGPIFIARILNDAGLFSISIPNAVLITAGTIVCLGLVYLLTQRIDRPGIRLGLWLVLGGATSNVIDRVLHGGVVDIITIRGVTSFNLADMMIILGAAALLRGTLWR